MYNLPLGGDEERSPFWRQDMPMADEQGEISFLVFIVLFCFYFCFLILTLRHFFIAF